LRSLQIGREFISWQWSPVYFLDDTQTPVLWEFIRNIRRTKNIIYCVIVTMVSVRKFVLSAPSSGNHLRSGHEGTDFMFVIHYCTLMHLFTNIRSDETTPLKPLP
jgi:hypothetical protein